MADSKIEWTDKVWNPVTGCRPYSAGCANCYAQTQSHIRGANPMPAMQRKYQGLTVLNSHGRPTFTGEVRTHEDSLTAPLHVKKPTTWFVNSMSDLFYGDEKDQKAAEAKGLAFTPVPFEFVDKVFAVMALCPQHTFQILTKRPGRMAEYFQSPSSRRSRQCLVDEACLPFLSRPFDHRHIDVWPLPNVWMGTSVENQAAAVERIPLLLKVPAAVRFLSCEPLIGPVDLSLMYVDEECPNYSRDGSPPMMDPETGLSECCSKCDYTGVVPVAAIDWVIAGGESGPGARPAHPDWFRSIRDECQAAEVAFFFKQWGDWDAMMECEGPLVTSANLEKMRVIGIDGKQGNKENGPYALVRRMGKKAAGRLLDGREWNEMPGSVHVPA